MNSLPGQAFLLGSWTDTVSEPCRPLYSTALQSRKERSSPPSVCARGQPRPAHRSSRAWLSNHLPRRASCQQVSPLSGHFDCPQETFAFPGSSLVPTRGWGVRPREPTGQSSKPAD